MERGWEITSEYVDEAGSAKSASRHEKQLDQTEKQQAKISGKLIKLYVALESGKLDMDDLAPRIKELRAYQHELQQQRDSILRTIESNEPEKLDANEVISYVNELEQVLGEASFRETEDFPEEIREASGNQPLGYRAGLQITTTIRQR